MGASLEVAGLTKSFGDMAAVRGLDFAVQPGQLFAFLGPNGAGKSTTINMLCTFLRPDRGRALINGYELGKQDGQIRASIGAVFQEGLLDRGLTVRENLLVRASFYGLNRAARGEAVLRAARAGSSWTGNTANSPADSGGGRISPGPWYTRPGFSFWMNPPPAWIPRPGAAYGKPCPPYGSRALPCS